MGTITLSVCAALEAEVSVLTEAALGLRTSRVAADARWKRSEPRAERLEPRLRACMAHEARSSSWATSRSRSKTSTRRLTPMTGRSGAAYLLPH